MANPVGKIFAELDLDKKKYTDGLDKAKTKGKKTLTEIEKAWKGLGKKSEATYDQMRVAVNANYDKIKRHASSTADDIYRAEKAKNDKIARINKQQFGEQKSLIDKAKKHWMAFSAVAIAAVYAIQRAFRTSLSMYADWEVALNRLGNVSDETIPEMRKKILSISPALGSVTELTKGYYQVLSAGVTEPLAAMDLLTTSAKMSKEASIEQSEAVKGLAALMGAYTTELTSATDAADLLYSIEKLGITTVTELTPLVGNLANMAKAVGLNADEMAAALAQVSTTGAGTNIAVTQLQSLLTALSKKFTLLPPDIKKYGSAIEAVKALGFQGVLKEIMRYTEGNSTALVKMLGRQEGYLALLQLSKSEFGGYSERLEEMTNKTGTFDDAWKRYSITLTAIWDTFKNTIGKQAVLIGEKLAPGIKEVVEKTSAWFTANEDIITQNMATVIDAIVIAVGALATVYETLAKAQKPIAEQVNKLSKEQRESIKLTLEQSTGLAGAKAVFELFAEAYTYWLDKFTKKEEEWIVTIGRRKKVVTATIGAITEASLREEQAMIKARLALEDNNAAMIAFASSIEVAAQKEEILITAFDLSIDSIKAGEKAYADHIEMVGKREDAIFKASKDATKAEEDYTKHVIKLADDAYKAHQQRLKDRGEAARDLYKDLGEFEKEYYKYSDELIQAQAQRYRDLGISEVAIAAWVTEEEKKAWRDRTLASDSFFGGVEVGWQDLVDAQATWAEHSKAIFDDVRGAWSTAINQMVTDYIQGELDKQSIAEITGNMLTDIAGRTSTRMFDAAIDKIIELIGAQLGMGAAGAGSAGSMRGGVTGALAEIGLYLSAGVAAMLAGRAMAEQFRAEGGWISSHPSGGRIGGGSGTRDDVFLGYTPGTRHWGMGGEFVINKESTAKHGALLEAINRDRGMMTGGYIDRAYQEGGMSIPWKPVADTLFAGTAASFTYGFITKGGLIGALVDAGIFLGSGIAMMFAGKLLANQFHGLGDLLTAPLRPVVDLLPSPIGDILGDDVAAISDYLNFRTGMMLDPEATWEMIKELIRTPLETVAKDLVTPGKYYSNPLDTISNIIDYLKSDATQAEQNLLGELTSFERGGKIPRTGLFYGHKDERVLNKEEARAYEGGGVTINSPLIHIGGNLIADKQTFDDFVEDIDYAITKRNKRVYA